GYPAPSGYPAYAPVPEPPKSSRTAIVIAVVVALVLIAGGGAAAYILISKDKTTPLAAPSTTTSSQTTKTTPPPTTSGQTKFAAPGRIGNVPKMTDPATLKPLIDQLKQGGLEDPFAAAYREASGRNVVIWGGTGSIFGIGTQQSRIDGFFAGASGQFGGAKVSGR